MTRQALAGIKVLDLSRILAGPTAAQLLGDCGAEVIKVERPGTGDDARRLGGQPLQDAQTGAPLDMRPMYLCANRNKRSITLDIARPEGQAIVRALAARSDVLIENYKTGDLARHGLDHATLRALNPRLIYCSITGFGQTGPYAGRVGFDTIFQAMSGLMSATGLPDGVPGGGPMRIGAPITDLLCGVYAYGAIVTALHHRDTVSGTGQHIDLALLDAAITAMCSVAGNYLATGAPERRTGVESPTTVPSRLFDCQDGRIQITAPSHEIFVRLSRVLGHPEWPADPRFATMAERIRHRDVLLPLVEQAVATWHRAELVEALEAADVPCAAIYTLPDVFADPQVQHRGDAVTVSHPVTGEYRIGTNPIRFSATPITHYSAPPLLGEHTREVLRDLLGMDDHEIETLKTKGVV